MINGVLAFGAVTVLEEVANRILTFEELGISKVASPTMPILHAVANWTHTFFWNRSKRITSVRHPSAAELPRSMRSEA